MPDIHQCFMQARAGLKAELIQEVYILHARYGLQDIMIHLVIAEDIICGSSDQMEALMELTDALI